MPCRLDKYAQRKLRRTKSVRPENNNNNNHLSHSDAQCDASTPTSTITFGGQVQRDRCRVSRNRRRNEYIPISMEQPNETKRPLSERQKTVLLFIADADAEEVCVGEWMQMKEDFFFRFYFLDLDFGFGKFTVSPHAIVDVRHLIRRGFHHVHCVLPQLLNAISFAFRQVGASTNEMAREINKEKRFAQAPLSVGWFDLFFRFASDIISISILRRRVILLCQLFSLSIFFCSFLFIRTLCRCRCLFPFFSFFSFVRLF